MPRAKSTTKGGQALTSKLERAGKKVKHVNAKTRVIGRDTLNANQSYTSDGRLSQAYNQDTKQFEKGTTSTKAGLMAVEGSKNTNGAKTWTYTNRDMEGNLISQSGRSQLSDRRQREYDTIKGLNNISPKVIQRWLETGIAKEVKGEMIGANGNVIRQKPDGTFSMGLTTG